MELAILERLDALRAQRQPVAHISTIEGGEDRLLCPGDPAEPELASTLVEAFRTGKSRVSEDGAHFINVYMPPVRIVVIGAVHISQALAGLAKIAGFDLTIIDPRTAFATPERFGDVNLIAEWPDDALKLHRLDAYTALVVLTHDPKIDDTPLKMALETGCFYIGALGSRKTHAKRVERLMRDGVSGEALATISAPVGLDIGGVTPQEIAVSILAEIIASLRKKPS